MKTLILLLIFTLSVFANVTLDDYRKNGIDFIQKQLDFKLTDFGYWDDYLDDKDLSFGYIQYYNFILTCDKESSKLVLYKKNKDEKFQLNKDYNAFTGKIKGDKIKEGDLKTPLGIYNLTKRIVKLDAFYGPLAFVTSYPNIYDKYKGKNGSGIWIHGLPTNQKRDKYTKGCIAIDNDNIKGLNKKINIEKTLLIINPDKNLIEVNKENIAIILSELYSWRYAWIYNNTDKYLNFYSDDFVKSNGMKINSFKRYKKRIFAKNEKKTIVFQNLNIIPYPNTIDTYQITFKELYKSNSLKFIGEKILIVKLTNNKMKIFTEN
ncbi:MAG: L,D-transpeptidase family protein [Campylobacterota bacterium]|nr:L,D-transpeptidase family protein [Campylobacterota bacterium]